VGAELFHADRWTDTKKVIEAFCDFAIVEKLYCSVTGVRVNEGTTLSMSFLVGNTENIKDHVNISEEECVSKAG
jgi:hypothetical protein